MSVPTPDEMCNEAYRRYQAGDPGMAARICRRILEIQPRQAEAVYLLGVIVQDAGQVEQASEQYRQATVLAPDNAVFCNALGEATLILGKKAEALDCFRKALALRPTYARGHNNLGRMLHAQGELAAARASFTEAVRLDPRYATAHNNLGAVVQAEGRLNAAVAHFRQALALQPNYPEAHFNLGTNLQAMGDPLAAVAQLQEAIRLRPNYARAHFHLGQVLEQLRQDHAALACYETAARLLPADAEVQRRLGDLLILKKDWPAALAALKRAVDLDPDKPEPFARLVYAKHQICDWRTYGADLERLWAGAEKQFAASQSTAIVPFQALTLPWPRERLLAIARSHADAIVRHQRERGQAQEFRHGRGRPGRLRVGYLSGDFYDHPISHLLHGLFGRHDREQFEVFAYSFGPPDTSTFRQQIAAECEHFEEVAALSIPALARRIAGDGIHILVDLMGHTGINRLAALALRPAPIQVSFLGMLGTTGADFIDYLITDRVVTPPAFAGTFVEKFVTLPDCYLIAEPLGPPAQPDSPESRSLEPDPRPAKGFVYCNFNSSYKIEPRTFEVWMRILAQVPDSVLWLQSAGAMFEENLRREAAARGVAAERLVFAPFLPRAEHVLRHRGADLFLDTLLYNAAATASLALQAGLPVLTCPGDTFASRVGASLLHAVGLPELIAPDLQHYEQQAVELARQPDLLPALRTKLAARRSTSPLFDTPRFVRHLEHAYLAMWECYAAGGSPQPIEVLEGGQAATQSSQAAARDGDKIRAVLESPAIFQTAEEMLGHRQRQEEDLAALAQQSLAIQDPLTEVNSTNFYAAYHGLNDRNLQEHLAALYLRATPSLAFVAPHCRGLREPKPGKPLRIGFVSRFLHMHTIGEVNVGLIRNLSRDVCRIVVLRPPVPDDPLGRLIRDSADEVVTLSPSLEAARMEIAEQRLDVLFYTDIGMDPFTYFLAFARLAPVQCTTWGHPVTTGIPAIDYYLSSVDLEPPGADDHYTENLVRLQGLPTFYYAPAFFPPAKTRRHFGLGEEDHLYMCPQAPFKVHPDFDALLAGILRADPHGKVLFIRSQNAEWTEQLLRRFRTTMPGELDRIQFLPHQRGQDYLHLLALCDVLLDTTHFGGGNTTFKAFSVGTPIVTLPGAFARGRVTSACYRKMGVRECIAADREDYVRIAVRLGTDPQWRQEVRTQIEAARGVLYENAGVLRELEQFFATAVSKAEQSDGSVSQSASGPRRLLIQSVMGSPPCNRVRVLEPNRFLAGVAGIRVQAAEPKGLDLALGQPGEEKVLIWQRAALAYAHGLSVQKAFLAKGYLLVAEMDDDPRHWPAYADSIAFTLRSCHCVQTSTEPLAELLRTFNPEVTVFANQLADLPPPRCYGEDHWVTLFFGAWGRENDWAPIMPALNRVLAAHSGRVRVKVIHDKRFWEALATEHKEWEAACAFERYQEILGSCDIGLLPLNPTPMNTMKSDLKFLECAGHGVAVLASPTVYDRSVAEGTTGLIYRSPEDFEVKLTRLIENLPLRRELAADAYQYVRDHRLLAQHFMQRHAWYLRMRDKLPELNEQMQTRLPELFSSRCEPGSESRG